MSGRTLFMAIIAGFAFWLLAGAVAPSKAYAGGGSSGCGCTTPPPSCCSPPSPPPVSPPTCCTPGHNVNIPGVNVYVAGGVQVNVQASASAGAAASSGAGTTVFYNGGGGGGGGGYVAPGATGLINGLNVEGGVKRTAYEATRSMYKKVVIQAFCFDDKEVPHPASQVSPDRDVDDAYDGELYRCIAGAHMQVTVAEWREKVSFEGGQTITCQKGEALYHVPGAAAGGGAGGGAAGAAGGGHGGGSLACRPQKPARDCNERSLLRRFGAGIKVLTIWYTERYTAYREESTSSAAAVGMSLDGGVGGIAY